MKKYIAYTMNTNGGGGTSNSGVQTLTKATEWARTITSKTSNIRAYVCEIVSVVERPDPVVTVTPFKPEPEEVEGLSVNHS